MEAQEGWVVYLVRCLLTFAFWMVFTFLIFTLIKKIKQDLTIDQVKNNLENIAQFFMTFVKACVRDLSLILDHDYKNTSFNVSNSTQAIRLIKALLIEMLIQFIRGMRLVLITFAEFAEYVKKYIFVNLVDSVTLLNIISTKLNFKQPVILSTCGHTIEKSSSNSRRNCPICATPYNKIQVKNSFVVGSLLEIVKTNDKTQSNGNTKNKNSSKIVYIFFFIILLYAFLPSSQNPQSFKDIILKKYNTVDDHLLSLEEYWQGRDNFTTLMSHKSGSKLKLSRGNSAYEIDVNVKVTKIQKYLTQMILTGKENNLRWVGQGFFMPKKEGYYFWMLITDITFEGQSEKYENDLIFESYIMKTPINQIGGKWYYLGKIADPLFNGNWKIQTIEQKNQLKKQKQNRKEIPQPVQAQKNDQKIKIQNKNKEAKKQSQKLNENGKQHHQEQVIQGL